MADSNAVDLLINARWILPIIPEEKIFEDCALIVNRGKIVAIAPQAEALKSYNAAATLNLKQHVLMPGLINAHGHAAMSLLRGYADDKPLQEWLEKHIWPTEARWVDEQFVKDGTELAIAEMIRSGTTCFADMYFYPEQAAVAAQTAGIRAQINFPVLDFPSNWAQDADDYLHKGLAVRDNYRTNALIDIGFGPHAPYTVADAPLQQIATLAEELDAPIQIHLHETAAEVEQAVSDSGQRPIERLQQLGLLSPLTQCVHMTQVSDSDIEILQQTGAHVIHCPESNLKLASGFCPVERLQQAGINVALGTDGAASNNDLDLFGELHTAALLAKAVSANAAALKAHKALQMATLNGAKALGLEEQIGSLETGKDADIIAVALNELETLPLYDICSQLVYGNNGHRVSHSWVQGKPLMLERQLQTLNSHELSSKARRWAEKLKQ